MNEYSVSAQYVFVLLVAEACELLLALLALAFPGLASWVFLAIRVPLVGLYFYALIILSDRFGRLFTIAMVCYLTNAVLMLMSAFVPSNDINAGLIAFLQAATEVLIICAAFFVQTGLMRIMRRANEHRLAKQLDGGRFVRVSAHVLKALLLVLSLDSSALRLAQVLAIVVDIFMLHLYQATHAAMSK